MTNYKEIIETLKQEAAKDKTLDAVLHVCALRRRTRQNMTMGGISQRMKLEGFSFESHQYAQVLRTLAKAGVGTLQTSASGKVVALKDIKVTLQSLGKAALGQEGVIRSAKARNKFIDLPAGRKVIGKQEISQITGRRKEDGLSLVVEINGKVVKIPVPEEFNEMDVSVLVRRLKNSQHA